MYYINKIIGFVVSPVGLSIIGGACALICFRLKRQRVAKWLGWASFAWLWLWMMPIMTWVVGAPLEREFLVDGRVPTVETFPAADAIILLGGGMGADTNHNSYAEMASGADRVWQAVRLFKAGKAPVIVATGFYPQDTTLPLLKDFGLAEDCVSFLEARNTEEEAKGIKELLERVDFQRRVAESQSAQSASKPRILLVTSAWHTKRARLMFKKYAPEIEVLCAPADFEQTMMAENLFFPKEILPDANAFYFNSVAFREWIGIVGYTLFR
jgi:uncharacterized SAM-binding protein YcdF (DUF218 family)